MKNKDWMLSFFDEKWEMRMGGVGRMGEDLGGGLYFKKNIRQYFLLC